MNTSTRTKHSWTVKEIARVYWLAQFGANPDLIAEVLSTLMKDVSIKAIKQVESHVQITWHMLQGANTKPASLPRGKTLVKYKQALASTCPADIEEYRPVSGVLQGPRRVRVFNNRKRAPSRLTNKAKIAKQFEDVNPWTASEVADVYWSVMAGQNSATVAQTVTNLLKSKRSLEDILKQEGQVRAFILKRINRDKEIDMTQYPVERNLQLIVNASKLPMRRELREIYVENSTVCPQRHLVPAPKEDEAETAVQQQLDLKPEKVQKTSPLSPEFELIDAIFKSAANNKLKTFKITSETLTIEGTL